MPAEESPLANHQRSIQRTFGRRGRGRPRLLLRMTCASCVARRRSTPGCTAHPRPKSHYLDYGTEVRITPGDLESFFLVQIPLAGYAEITCGREEIISSPELASVPSPTGKLDMRWGDGNPQLIVWFDRSSLESHLGSLLGRTVRRPLLFSLGMNLTTPGSRSWLNIVDLMRREAEGPGGMTSRPVVTKQLESLLMTQLLMAQSNNYTSALLGEQPRVAPPAVRRAMEVIEGHAAEPLTVAEIAECVGVGVRALRKASAGTSTRHRSRTCARSAWTAYARNSWPPTRVPRPSPPSPPAGASCTRAVSHSRTANSSGRRLGDIAVIGGSRSFDRPVDQRAADRTMQAVDDHHAHRL